jgi:hypothetical protein
VTINNRQKAEDYYKRCKQFLKQRMAERNLIFSAEGKVIRSQVYEAINASRAVMNQNPRIKRLLGATERLARMKGLTSAPISKELHRPERAFGGNDPQITKMQARLNYLEKQVAALTVENRELRKAVKRAEWIDKFINDPNSKQGALPW